MGDVLNMFLGAPFQAAAQDKRYNKFVEDANAQHAARIKEAARKKAEGNPLDASAGKAVEAARRKRLELSKDGIARGDRHQLNVDTEGDTREGLQIQ